MSAETNTAATGMGGDARDLIGQLVSLGAMHDADLARNIAERLDALLATRPAESVAQGGDVDLVTTSHRDGCSLSHCPNSLASCGCPAPTTGSGGDVPEEVSTAMLLLDMGLAFALCHRGFPETRNAVKDLQSHSAIVRDWIKSLAHPAPAGGDAGGG